MGRREAWSYANDMSGSMFLGCGDDFKLVASLGCIEDNAVSFEARAKPKHYVMLREGSLVLADMSAEVYDSENYASSLAACSFRLIFCTTTRQTGCCFIESCLEPRGMLAKGDPTSGLYFR